MVLRLNARRLLRPLLTARRSVRTGAEVCTSQFRFESSPLADSDLDCSLLEKSIHRGCRSFLCRSGENSMRLFELIMDLSADDDLKLDECTIGHHFKEAAGGAVEYAKEVKEIEKMLKGNKLSYLALPVSSLQISTSELAAQIQGLQGAIGPDSAAPPRVIGLDLSTGVLQQADSSDVDRFIEALKALPAAMPSGTPAPPLSIATNCLTASLSRRIAQGIKNAGFGPIIASEVLRTHARRPGLITAPVLPLNLLTAPNAIHDAVADFSTAMNRCIHVEKQFMERFHSNFKDEVPAKDICWGHVLHVNQEAIVSPEEWTFLLSRQIEPKLKITMDIIKSKGTECSEWCTMYSPMSKYLFSTMLRQLQHRKWAMFCEVYDASAIDSSEVSGSTQQLNDDAVPVRLGALVAALGFDQIAMSGCEVSEEWGRAAEEYIAKVNPELAEAILTENVRKVVKDYVE